MKAIVVDGKVTNHEALKRACRTCSHSLAFGALCECREKSDMAQHDCPDWHSAKIRFLPLLTKI